MTRTWLIIGSTAMHHWFSGSRVPADIDLLTPASIKSDKSELCIIDTQWHDAAEYLMSVNHDPVFADPNVLFTLKVSHAQWDIKWKKTMSDIAFMKSKGCELNEDLHSRLIPVWESVHGAKRVNMAQSMDTFFNDAVEREYDHEELHRLVAFYDRPLHEYLRPDHGTAWCSFDLFDCMPYENQLKVAMEEMMATAIERRKLKLGAKRSELISAMSYAYFKLCTSMTKGWFAQFLTLNQHELFQRREQWIPQMNKALSALSTTP